MRGDEPAHPLDAPQNEYVAGIRERRVSLGLTIRERFALAALQGLCANAQYTLTGASNLAREACRVGNETLAELAREKSEACRAQEQFND